MANESITYSARLKDMYRDKAKAELKANLRLKNIYEVPKITKVIVSSGIGRGKDDKRLFEAAKNTISKITGQNPIVTKSRKSIASFKLREGQSVGLKVTLRGNRMYEFLDRLITIVLPRLRDFHGMSSGSFDKSGNYNIGFEDQTVFPELSFEETTVSHGIQVTIVIDSKEQSHSKELLAFLGLPFAKEDK